MEDIKRIKRLLKTIAFICVSLIVFKPFVVSQIAARADGYLMYRMYKDAVRKYKKALILDPRNNRIRNNLGYTYRCMDKINEAVKIYEKAIILDVDNIVAYHDLGMIYAREKNFELAKEYFSKAGAVPESRRKDLSEEEYIDYHERSLDMLAICEKKLKGLRR